MQTFIIGSIKFDNLLCVSLKKEVFIKLPLIRKYVFNEDHYNMLLQSLKFVHEQPTERILDSISATNDEMVKHFGQRITQETSALYFSSVLWEWFYLLAYYMHQIDNDPLWQENYLPHAKAFQIRSLAIEETEKGEKLIDQFIAKRQRVLETQKQIQQPAALHGDDFKDSKASEYISQIATLEHKIKELEAENTSLKNRIEELESQNKHPHLTFIQTEGKNPDQIKWAYEDIRKAIVGPAEMAECLHNLQVQGMLKNQERYGQLKKIKKIHEELQQAYGFDWKYDALRRALNRIISKK